MSSNQSDAQIALKIVGAEDFSDDGEPGRVTLEGDMVGAILREQGLSEFFIKDLVDKPMKIHRGNIGLDLWCNGFYMEGKGIRRLVHGAYQKVFGDNF